MCDPKRASFMVYSSKGYSVGGCMHAHVRIKEIG